MHSNDNNLLTCASCFPASVTEDTIPKSLYDDDDRFLMAHQLLWLVGPFLKLQI